MSTAIDYQSSSPTNIRSRHHHSPLDNTTTNMSIELADFKNSSSPPPPAYTEQPEATSASETHHAQLLSPPALKLQIETTGKPIISLPLPPQPDPVPIYLVDPSSVSEGSSSASSIAPKFMSLRPTRGSGSCYLISGDVISQSSESPAPLSTTTYRFGPGRPPRVRLFSPYSSVDQLQQGATGAGNSNPLQEPEADQESRAYSSFDVLSSGLFTRAVRFRPPRLLPDTTTRTESEEHHEEEEKIITDAFFEWRYATKKERKAFHPSVPSSASSISTSLENENIDSLLILSKTTITSPPTAIHSHVPPPKKGKATATITTPLAYFIRSASLRTRGSSVSSAGNGGRLEILDLGRAGYGEEMKTEREMVVVMVATTCLAMLKREVDRRRAQQIAVMAGAAGGGP